MTMPASTVARQQRAEEITIEDARIVFRNFEGREEKFNAIGNRNFSILLEPGTAKVLEDKGWNVKILKARDEDGEDQPYIQVSVSYKARPPRVILLTSRGRTPLDEETVHLMDFVDLDTVDVTLNPYSWEVNGKNGVKAYLKTMYTRVREDPLDLKYAGYEEELRGIDDGDIVDAEIVDDQKAIGQ
jgi:hypothetical protein